MESKTDGEKSATKATPGMKILALLGALLVVAAATVAIYSIQAARETVHGIALAFQPNVKASTVLGGTIGQLNSTPKLVVLTADILASVIQENTTTFAGIDVGTAKVEVNAPAKIQYYVPLNTLTEKDFRYDEAAKRLIVTVPKPILDTDVVAIDTNPDKISVRTEFGWSPLSVFKGKYTKDDAMRHLKEAALQQGGHELLKDRAEKEAKATLIKQMGLVTQNLNSGVTLDVEFKK